MLTITSLVAWIGWLIWFVGDRILDERSYKYRISSKNLLVIILTIIFYIMGGGYFVIAINLESTFPWWLRIVIGLLTLQVFISYIFYIKNYLKYSAIEKKLLTNLNYGISNNISTFEFNKLADELHIQRSDLYSCIRIFKNQGLLPQNIGFYEKNDSGEAYYSVKLDNSEIDL